MNEGKKEDLMEEVYLLTRNGTSSIPVSCLLSHLKIPCAELEELIAVLRAENALCREPCGEIALTACGRILAEQVVKKHQILEHFFVEMLGVDPHEAAKEACRLEHHISDELTGRLSDLVNRSAGKKGPDGIMETGISLLDCREGDSLVILRIDHPGKLHRLMDLGFLPGERIVIKRKLRNRALVVAVKGCDIALSPDIASLIRVEKPA
ncbi:MAG: metal-dependent transcriptional regulator [Methanomicrobiales archaeon]|nr:metal-dependent transcriptional regulator [Methanomicrobiales archaeon]